MLRTHFIPARNSRHCTAVLALYRALLRRASKIVLPDTIGPFSAASKPLEHILRRQFQRNSRDKSSRLIFAAMTAGYKFLSLLDRAIDPSSAEYNQIIQQLSVQDPPRPPPEPTINSASKVGAKNPLLIKSSSPGEPPEYTSDQFPKPRRKTGRPRRVPIMAVTAQGQPFLRIVKPQPHDMSRMIGLKDRLHESIIIKIVHVQDELIPESKLEDDWDRIVARQLRKENVPDKENDQGLESSFIWSPNLSRLWYEWKLESIRADWIARSEALQRIVDMEQQLADEEAGRAVVDSHVYPGMEKSQAQVKVSNFNYMKPLLSQVVLTEEQGQDIFSTQAWAGVVKSRKETIRSKIKEAQRA